MFEDHLVPLPTHYKKWARGLSFKEHILIYNSCPLGQGNDRVIENCALHLDSQNIFVSDYIYSVVQKEWTKKFFSETDWH